MKLRVKLFARARDLAAADTLEVELAEDASVGDLRQAVGRKCPALAPLLPSLLFAMGSDYAGDGEPIRASAEIACFPPVSGG